MKKLRILLLLLVVAVASHSASAALLCPGSNWPCRYINVNGCCLVWSSAPGYYCPEWCD